MIYLVDIEAIPSRYSEQWRRWIPKMIGEDKCHTISGTDYHGLSSGGFFDFVATNRYKSEQVIKLADMIKDGSIKNGDVIFFYDIWHPGIINLKYMLDLSGLNDVKIAGYLHAGAYDKTDILGINNLGRWCSGFEVSMSEAADLVYVASQYHKDMLLDTRPSMRNIEVVGWPYDFGELDSVPKIEKKDIFVFPHRMSVDKQPDIFEELKAYYYNYEFVYTAKENLSKDEYHDLLAESKYVFSSALHENLGIAVMEASYLGCIPILPDRCSYSEMYDKRLLYGNTQNVNDILKHVDHVIANYEEYSDITIDSMAKVVSKYFNFDKVKNQLIDWNKNN